jgi:aspartate kinase
VTGGGAQVTLGFTVEGVEEGQARAIADLLAQRFNVRGMDINTNVVRVSIIGVGMRSHHGVAARMFAALAAAGINIESISTSEIVISVLVPAQEGERALQVVHQAFGLDQGGGA